MARRRRLFLCPPTFYDVTYSINPYMDPSVPVDRNKAWRQWTQVVAELDDLGQELIFVEPKQGCPDMVFLGDAGDAGVVVGNRFLCSRFRHKEREPEAAHYVESFGRAGFEVIELPEGALLEGLGDVAIGGRSVVLGFGPRSNREGLQAFLSFAPGLKVVAEVELPDPRFYHLATAVVFLDPETVMYAPQGLTADGVAALKRAVPRTIAVSDDDIFGHQACNCIVLDKHILIDGCSAALRGTLEELGFSVGIFPASEFKKGGGSVRCLLLPEVDP